MLAPPQPWVVRMLEAERRRLALWLPVALACGILLYFALWNEPHPAWALAGLLPLPVAVWLARRAVLAGWAMGLAAAAGLGFALALLHAALVPPMLDPPRTALIVTGTVAETDLLPEGARLTLAGIRWAEDMPPARRTIRVRLRADDAARPQPGDMVRIRALLRPPPPPTHPGGWDFQRAAYFAGQGGSGFALGPVEILAQGGRAPPLSGWRATIEARVTAALPGAPGGIAAALLTGGQSAVPSTDLAAMRDSGLVHLLSVSGLHIGLVMGMAFFVVRGGLALWPGFALRFGTRAPAALAALAAGGFYMVLTGSQVPMQRSFAMAALVTVALLAGRRAFSPRVLAFAAVVVLALHPAVVLGPSFQMSFFAVMALVAGWEVARPWLRRDAGPRRWWWWPLAALAGTALTSVLAGLATTPPGLHHFGRVQLYGVAANALAVPLTSVLVMPAGMLALLLMPLGLEQWPLWIMGWGVRGILAVAHAVASWPGAALSLAPPPAWGLLVTALGMCWLCLWRTRWRLWGLPAALGGMLAGAVAPPPDALVAGDGRLFALRATGEVFVERRPGASRFVQESWLRVWGASGATPLPAQGEVAGGRITCAPDACTMRDEAGTPRLVLLRPPIPRRNERLPPQYAPREVCGTVPLILSPEPLRGRCPGTLVVDRFSLWRNGAHAAWSMEGRVLSDRDWRGDRPWVPPEPRPRGEEVLPPAMTE